MRVKAVGPTQFRNRADGAEAGVRWAGEGRLSECRSCRRLGAVRQRCPESHRSCGFLGDGNRTRSDSQSRRVDGCNAGQPARNVPVGDNSADRQHLTDTRRAKLGGSQRSEALTRNPAAGYNGVMSFRKHAAVVAATALISFLASAGHAQTPSQRWLFDRAGSITAGDSPLGRPESE